MAFLENKQTLDGTCLAAYTTHVPGLYVQRDPWRPNRVKDVLSGPSSGLADPRLIRDCDSKQIWDMSNSMRHACSCATGSMHGSPTE